MSLAAQFLLNAKKIQNWLFWIAADVIYIPLYFTKHLNLTGLVYCAFLGLAIAGGIQWRRRESTARESQIALAATTATAPVPA